MRVDGGNWKVLDDTCKTTEIFISQSSIPGFKGRFEVSVAASRVGAEECSDYQIAKHESPLLVEVAEKPGVEAVSEEVTGEAGLTGISTLILL